MKPEILAPAGSFESLVAAVRCGADAVYLGGKSFNARRNASNFTDDELRSAIDYCHKRNVKVYITLNTLASDTEFENAGLDIRLMCDAGADAFIVQDLGLASLIRKICPSAVLHASTQMSVQSAEGIKILGELGFSRAVLPRELSAEEIRKISASTDMELEYFVHGALCMCLSGQCLMSSVIGGRSGNRGLCAQPCRLPFGINSRGGNNLSLKDLSLIDRIGEIARAGVCSLKIEGRMKRPEYVAAAVTACRNSINNVRDEKISSALGAVFSRSGFTSGYFDGRMGKEMFGIRTKEDVESSASVLSDLSHLYDNENPLLETEMFFSLKKDSYPFLRVRCGRYEATAVSDSLPAVALNKEITPEDARARLSKCGGTQFFAGKVECDIDSGLNIPASVVNSLRRDALTCLENRMAEREKREIRDAETAFDKHTAKERKLHVRFFDPDQISGEISADRVIVPLETPDGMVKMLRENGCEVAAEIPVNVFSKSGEYVSELLELKKAGATLAWACNIDGIEIARKAGLPFASGFGMNIYNSQSLKVMEELGAEDCLISCEAAAGSISKLGGEIGRGVMVYGRIPLMITRNCPVRNKLSCKECGRNSVLVDRMDVRFPVRCRNGCSFIFNSLPLCVYDKPDCIGYVDYDLIYFTVETASECTDIIDGYRRRLKQDCECTRGLYFRNVL